MLINRMMIYHRYIFSQILVLFIISSTGEPWDDIIEINTFVTNESVSISNTSSPIPTVLSTSNTMSNNLTSSPTSRRKGSGISLVDQINAYRYTRILTRIKHCDSNMRLNDICETYSIDNDTNTLIRQLDIDFLTFEDLFDRLIVGKLDQFYLTTNSSLGNLSNNDIQFTMNAIQEHGRSFCSLEKCHTRLTLFIDSCPTLSNRNISQPTLKLLPMLCTLYNEQLNWNSTECIDEIVYLLHLFYAFWPQFEKCYVDISAGLNGCTSECQTFDHILTKLEQQCNGNALFLSQMPVLSWYRSINLKEICYHSTKTTFLHTVENFFSSKRFWSQFYEKPIYRILFMIFAVSLVISFSACFYFKSKYRLKINNRRFEHDYEYTRLHSSSFELGTNSEIPNSTTNGLIDEETQLDSNDRFHASEHQRLLFVNS